MDFKGGACAVGACVEYSLLFMTAGLFLSRIAVDAVGYRETLILGFIFIIAQLLVSLVLKKRKGNGKKIGLTTAKESESAACLAVADVPVESALHKPYLISLSITQIGFTTLNVAVSGLLCKLTGFEGVSGISCGIALPFLFGLASFLPVKVKRFIRIGGGLAVCLCGVLLVAEAPRLELFEEASESQSSVYSLYEGVAALLLSLFGWGSFSGISNRFVEEVVGSGAPFVLAGAQALSLGMSVYLSRWQPLLGADLTERLFYPLIGSVGVISGSISVVRAVLPVGLLCISLFGSESWSVSEEGVSYRSLLVSSGISVVSILYVLFPFSLTVPVVCVALGGVLCPYTALLGVLDSAGVDWRRIRSVGAFLLIAGLGLSSVFSLDMANLRIAGENSGLTANQSMLSSAMPFYDHHVPYLSENSQTLPYKTDGLQSVKVFIAQISEMRAKDVDELSRALYLLDKVHYRQSKTNPHLFSAAARQFLEFLTSSEHLSFEELQNVQWLLDELKSRTRTHRAKRTARRDATLTTEEKEATKHAQNVLESAREAGTVVLPRLTDFFAAVKTAYKVFTGQRPVKETLRESLKTT